MLSRAAIAHWIPNPSPQSDPRVMQSERSLFYGVSIPTIYELLFLQPATDSLDILFKGALRQELFLEECSANGKPPGTGRPYFLDPRKGSDTARRYNGNFRCIDHLPEQGGRLTVIPIREQIQTVHAIAFQLTGMGHNLFDLSIQDAWMTMDMTGKGII